MTEYAIDIVNITKRFAGHTAVHDLTLRVPTGSVYGLLGPNGAGKTTTIRMILNIIAPDSGMIHIFGRPSNDPKITERLGYLPEERGLYRKMQVRRVLKFLAELKGVRGSDADRRIDECVRVCGGNVRPLVAVRDRVDRRRACRLRRPTRHGLPVRSRGGRGRR